MPNDRAQGGFTLIEVVIALAILALGFSTFTTIARTAIDRITVDEDSERLAQQAQALWREMALRGLRDARDIDRDMASALPNGLEIELENLEPSELDLDGWIATSEIEFMRLVVRDESGRQFVLTGVMRPSVP